MNMYDLARGLHILSVIAWMAGLLFLPRLYAYDAEQSDKPEPLRTEMRTLLRLWQARLLRIILNPAAGLALIFGAWLIHQDIQSRGAGFLAQPWMVVKLTGVVLLFGWHGYLTVQRRLIAEGRSRRSARFWRMTNEIPFLLAIVMVLAVTTEFGA